MDLLLLVLVLVNQHLSLRRSQLARIKLNPVSATEPNSPSMLPMRRCLLFLADYSTLVNLLPLL